MTKTRRLPWTSTPAWLRRLDCDATIYGDAALAALVRLARTGDDAAMAACRRYVEAGR